MMRESIIEEIVELQENKNKKNILNTNAVDFNQINLLNNNDHSNSVNEIQQTKWQYLKHKLNSLSNSKHNVNDPLHTKIAQKIFASTGTFIIGVSSVSILLSFLHFFTYQQQLDIISSIKFSSMTLTCYGLFNLVMIILGILKIAHEGKELGKDFNSIWIPISHVMTISLLVPDSNGVSVFSYFVKMLVSFIANF